MYDVKFDEVLRFVYQIMLIKKFKLIINIILKMFWE